MISPALLGCLSFSAFAADGIGLTAVPPAEVHVPGGPVPDPPSAIPIQGPWRLIGSVDGVRSYEAPIPIRPRSLFFQSAPEGMRLLRHGMGLTYGAGFEDRGRMGSWEFTADSVIVRIAPSEDPPYPGEYKLVYREAYKREQELYPAATDATDPDWPRRSMQVGDVTREGLYLPVPSRMAWVVDVPKGAVLRFTPLLIPPEVNDLTTSDGADINILADNKPLARVRVRPGEDLEEIAIPLAPVEGTTIRLVVNTADQDPVRDHVFLAQPQIYVPSDKPRRMVLVFVDTLRRDHLGTYGYERAPAPAIDALAAQSVVFEDARSVAPWTLPSARSALTGKEPEVWTAAETLSQRLAARGWATGAYVGNIYLSSNFDMAAGWGEHGCINWPAADVQVERGIRFLREHADQDALVMVHLMDLHLPYKEPFWYWRRYVDHQPEGLGLFFSRNILMRVARVQRPELRQYLIDRYDQNLAYVDDAVSRLLREAGDDATVVFFSDHGEEFFDHDDLEHGHSLYDELMRIPLFIKDGQLAPRRVPEPVSLLDLTPTLLDLLGLSHDGLDGRSLLPEARGERSEPHRPIAFGRVLYGETGWGTVLDGQKWIYRQGAEHIYDLAADPGELADLRNERSPLPGRAALEQALGRKVRLGFRLSPGEKGAPTSGVEVRVPGGIELYWIADDPTQKSTALVKRVDDETISASFTGFLTIQREVFIVPRRPAEEVVGEVTLRMARPTALPMTLLRRPIDAEYQPLAKVSYGARGYEIGWAVVPEPAGEEINAFNAEMKAGLEAIGYLTDDREPGPSRRGPKVPLEEEEEEPEPPAQNPPSTTTP